MSEVTKVVSAENAPINSSMNYAKKYDASYEDSGGSGGDGSIFIVNGAYSNEGNTITLDKTVEEIYDAAATGTKLVMLFVPYDSDNEVPAMYGYLGAFWVDDDYGGGFSFAIPTNNDVAYYYFSAEAKSGYPSWTYT